MAESFKRREEAAKGRPNGLSQHDEAVAFHGGPEVSQLWFFRQLGEVVEMFRSLMLG